MSKGQKKETDKVYLEFIKANFIIPIEKNTEEPTVLFLRESDTTYLPVFTTKQHLDQWAQDIREHIDLLTLSGVDLLKGLGPGTAVALNPGATIYKTFDASELLRLKNMILKLFKNQ